MTVRVRFAPSPTGFLHIGGARTALFNWLYARHTGGTFILRIEDTDTARNTQEAVDVILHGLHWLGLDWNEGPTSPDAAAAAKGNRGPYFQSQRLALYKNRVEELKRNGYAYDHDGAVKFKMDRHPIRIRDLIVGEVRRELTDREQIDPDFVIVRSDGQPVFHLVNVVDDLEMGITHVIRGEDHLANTAKHIALFRAFGVAPPLYAHIPLILNTDGTKMSKRDKGASLTTYMDEAYVPAAVVNYLCLLGWSPKDDRQILAIDDVIRLFDIPQILRHNARFDWTKLQWMNAEYLRTMTLDRYLQLALPVLQKAGSNLAPYPDSYIQAALATCKEKVKLLPDLPAFAAFYFQDDFPYDPDAAQKDFVPENKPRLAKVRDAFATTPLFTADSLQEQLKSVATNLNVKIGALVHPTRLACTGKPIGPSLYHLLEILGRDRVLQRLDRALTQF